MDLSWLTAEEQELEAAIEELDEDERPEVERRNFVPTAIAQLLLLGYFGVVWLLFADSIDVETPRVAPGAVGVVVLHTAVFVALWSAIQRLDKRMSRPPRDVEVRAWREHLTGLVNDVDVEPVNRATFVSLITGDRRTARCRPRYSAPGVEFGNLASRTHSYLEWHYLATELPAPLPHLILESRAAGPLPKELARAEIGQSLSLGYPFDHHFTLYAPRGYERDALYVLTPAVMAVLLDHATDFHVEIIGDTLVFFAPDPVDFGRREPWEAIDGLWMNAVPALVKRAQRYRDERVPDQSFSRRLLSFREALSTPGYTWARSDRRISQDGRRLARRKPRVRWSIVRKYGFELAVYRVIMGAVWLAFAGVLVTAWRLHEAFFGG